MEVHEGGPQDPFWQWREKVGLCQGPKLLPSSALPACSIPTKLRSVPCGLSPGGEGIGLASGGGISV